jgi:DHA1 family tetracycline resistance protein-like MFS transporter
VSEETAPESPVAPGNLVDTPPARGMAVAFIFVTILLDMFALGQIMPSLPKLVESFKK